MMDTVQLPNKVQNTINVHKGPVHIVKFNSTGKYVLTGGSDQKIHLINASKKQEEQNSIIQTYPTIHQGPILSIDIANDNASFVSSAAAKDRNVIVWDVTSSSIIRKFSNHSGSIHSVMFAGTSQQQRQDLLFTAGDDCYIRIYDLRQKSSFKPLMEIKDAKDTILALTFDRTNNDRFWSGSIDGCLRKYDIRKGQLDTDSFPSPITSITPSLSNSSLLVSTLAKNNHANHILFDVQDGRHLQTIQGGINKDYRCKSTLWANDSTIIAGDENGKICAWDILKGNQLDKGEVEWQSAHDKAVLWVDITAKQGGRMVSASADGTVKLWSCGNEQKNVE